MLSNDQSFKLIFEKKNVGIGRRKSSVARIFLRLGTGNLVINNKPGLNYLQFNKSSINKIFAPLQLLNIIDKYDIKVLTNGGGLIGQTEAIRLGVARLLSKLYLNSRYKLKSAGFLTRDPRIVERKKYGLKKARKAPQYSKR